MGDELAAHLTSPSFAVRLAIAAENGKKDTLRVLNSGQRAAETAIMSTGFTRFKKTPLILFRLSIERAGGQGECGGEERGWLV